MTNPAKKRFHLPRAFVGVEQIQRLFTTKDCGWPAKPDACFIPTAKRLLSRGQQTSDTDKAIRLLWRQSSQFAAVRQRLTRQDYLIQFGRSKPPTIEDELHRTNGQTPSDQSNEVHRFSTCANHRCSTHDIEKAGLNVHSLHSGDMHVSYRHIAGVDQAKGGSVSPPSPVPLSSVGFMPLLVNVNRLDCSLPIHRQSGWHGEHHPCPALKLHFQEHLACGVFGIAPPTALALPFHAPPCSTAPQRRPEQEETCPLFGPSVAPTQSCQF